MHSQFDPTDTRDANDANDSHARTRPQTWRERHMLKILGSVMAVMFATVIIAQVAC